MTRPKKRQRKKNATRRMIAWLKNEGLWDRHVFRNHQGKEGPKTFTFDIRALFK